MHDAYDWWADIVLPAIGGVGTLLVSVVSLVIAVNALKMSRRALRIEEERRGEESRAARAEIAQLIERWFDHTVDMNLGMMHKDDPRLRTFDADSKALVVRVQSLGDPAGPWLLDWAGSQALEVDRENRGSIKTNVSVWLMRWIQDPEDARRRMRSELGFDL